MQQSARTFRPFVISPQLTTHNREAPISNTGSNFIAGSSEAENAAISTPILFLIVCFFDAITVWQEIEVQAASNESGMNCFKSKAIIAIMILWMDGCTVHTLDHGLYTGVFKVAIKLIFLWKANLSKVISSYRRGWLRKEGEDGRRGWGCGVGR